VKQQGKIESNYKKNAGLQKLLVREMRDRCPGKIPKLLKESKVGRNAVVVLRK
jgi:hypothetical protein